MWKLVPQTDPEYLAQQAAVLLPPGLPVEIEEIIRIMAIEVTPFDLPDSISGIYNEINGQPYIAVNSKHSAARRRFTIAHELYHFLTELCEDTDLALDTEGGLDEIERKANRFAATILMPRDAVHALWSKCICVKHMAETFNVSEQAMQIRLKDLGLRTKDLKVSHGHIAKDCCELARIQRVARQPYIEQSLSSWPGAWMVREGSQMKLPLEMPAVYSPEP